MELMVERVNVWAAPVNDEPGALARLLNRLKEAGADFDFVLARRAPENPGTGVVFITPLQGEKEVKAAEKLGFNLTNSVHSIRVEGINRPGMAAEVTGAIARENVSMRGFCAAAVGSRFIFHIAVDSCQEADQCVKIIRGL